MTTLPSTSTITALLCRFLGVGAIATLAHQLVFILMLMLGAPWLGSVCGAAVGAVVNFWLTRKACFVAQNGKRLQPYRFVYAALAHNFANAILMSLLLRTSLPPLFAQMLITGCLTVVSFFIHRYWTYNHVDLTHIRSGR